MATATANGTRGLIFAGYNRAMNAHVNRRAGRRGINRRDAGEWKSVAGLLAALPAGGGERPADAAAQRRLAAFWARHFGDAAARSSPLLFDSGRLVVVVDAAAWGQAIRHRAPGLLEDLARAGIAATSVTVKTRPPMPSPPSPPPRPRFRLSAASAARIEALAKTVQHPPLAEALRRLARRAGDK